MATKLQLAALLLGAALCASTAFAKPPPGATNTYTPPPAATESTDTTTQVSNGQGVATPNTNTNTPPPAANPDRRFSSQQRARMRACINNCIAAGMTGPFCSHSCIPD